MNFYLLNDIQFGKIEPFGKNMKNDVEAEASQTAEDDAAALENLSGIVNHTLKIDENLHSRINKLIPSLKKLVDHRINKKKWLLEAFKSRLDEISLHEDEILIHKYLSFQLEAELDKNIGEQVEILKRFRGNYSKKKWFLEAISTKIERDEASVKSIKINLSTQDLRALRSIRETVGT